MELNWMSSVWILNFISLNSVAVWLNEARNQKAELGSEMKNEFWLKKEEWMISFQDIHEMNNPINQTNKQQAN